MTLRRGWITAAMLTAAVTLFASHAFALPVLQSAGRTVAQAGAPDLGAATGDRAIVGGSKAFGSALISAQSNAFVTPLSVIGSGDQRNDNYRRARFVRLVNTTNDVPEPAAIWLLGAGAVVMLAVLRRRVRAS